MSILVGATSACAGAAGQGPSADLGDTIDQSLRFTGAGRLVSADTKPSGDYTLAFWWKRGDDPQGSATDAFFTFTPNGGYVFVENSGIRIKDGGTLRNISDGALRDYSAWYHICIISESGTSRCYVNGVKQNNTGAEPTGGVVMCIGSNQIASQDDAFVGYLAEFILLDGTVVGDTNDILDEFGRYNEDGVWVPKEISFTSAQYGAKGFRLTFDSSQTNAGIGEDSAPIGASGHTARNDFTATGFDTAAISSSNPDNDVDYFDTPTSNYSTYNPLVNNDEPTFNQANLDGDVFNNGIAWATQELPDEHLYCEFIRTAGDRFAAGVWDAEDKFEKGAANDNDYAFGIVYSEFGGSNRIYNESTTASQTGLTAYSTGDVLGVEWRGDLATRQVNFYINGTQVGTSENVAAGGRYYFGAHRAGGATGPSVQVNFGQMPFVAAPAGITNTANGMQTNNLTEPTIKNGKEYFGILTYTGNGSTLVVTDTDAVQFTPDLVWIKKRGDNGGATAVREHILIDSVRGKDGSYYWNLSSNDNLAETSSDHVSAIGEGSITVHDITSGTVNQNLNTFIAWCWKAGGTAVSNTNGTITSSVSANTDAGFSIVSYTGNQTSGATVGHGLGVTPECIILKDRDTAVNWIVYHKGIDASNPEQFFLHLNSDVARQDLGDVFNDVAPGSSVFTLGNSTQSNGSTKKYIAYCWHSVEGFSKFGSYIGNDSTDGPFVYTGFKPAFIIMKAATQGFDWYMWDTVRNPNNPAETTLEPSTSANEDTASSPVQDIDILSNGFKPKSGNQINQPGATIIYCAWAENPFGGENAPPATAR